MPQSSPSSKGFPRKQLFELADGVIYLDGNSLGPLPKAAAASLQQVVHEQWGQKLIHGWNECGWLQQPSRVGNKLARLVGAPAGSVVVGDTLSIKIYQALAAALKLKPTRKVILSDKANFPTDLYMAEGLVRTLGADYELRLVDRKALINSLDQDVAVVMLTEVDYRSGARYDMHSITAAAHQAGAVMFWDLAHSVGALPVDLSASHCEFAAGCTYKYLNAGPGAPAFIYIRPDLIDRVQPALAGWLGHAAPFAFESAYRPAASIERMRVGTPPVLAVSALEAALELWDDVDMHELRAASIQLSELFISEVASRCPDLELASPRDPEQRGSQVAFYHEHAYAAIQALADLGVIGDFRAPNLMRFGIAPLYLDGDDLRQAAKLMQRVFRERLWQRPQYSTRKAVT